jgi:hypothetical protein
MFSNKKTESRLVLPDNVRYALRYKNSLLNGQEIESLVRNNFENEALYLIFKSLIDNPERHRAFLEKCLNSILESKHNEEDIETGLRKILNEELGNIGDVSVQAGKLAQLSRQGFDLWQERFQAASVTFSNDNRNIFLVAHTMLIGLSKFIKAFSDKDKELNIIVPAWLENDNIGYNIIFKDGKAEVRWLQGLLNHIDSIVVDDTQNSGHTFRQIKEYFIKLGFPSPELMTVNSL